MYRGLTVCMSVTCLPVCAVEKWLIRMRHIVTDVAWSVCLSVRLCRGEVAAAGPGRNVVVSTRRHRVRTRGRFNWRTPPAV